jgi:amino acid adenylation domain-containing protein
MSNKSFMRDIAVIASRYAKEKEYWLNKLSGRFVRSSFPYDFNKMEEGQRDDLDRPLERVERMEFKISGGVFKKLMWIVNNSDLRLFMILVSGLMVLLGKHTGQEDILVGAPIERQEVEGNFLNTLLALRAQLDAGITFKELLLQVRQAVVEAGENQNFPIERIPYELNMEVQKNDAFALFDTAILLRNLHDRKYIAHIPLNMVFSFLRTAESIEGVVEYNPALYKKETVQGITGHFVHLFRETVSNLDIPYIKLNIMPENEREFLLVKMNDTQAEYPNATIHELFEIQVEKAPGNIAVEEADTGRTMTYKELNRRTNQLANLLMEKGVKPGKIAAVMGERTCDIIASILAILKVGGVFLPLDAHNPDERLHFMLEDSGAYIFISQVRIIGEHEVLFNTFSPGTIIAMDDECIYKRDKENPRIVVPPSNPAYIIYTSGTTGKPKGVIVEHRSLVNYIQFAIENYVKEEAVNFPLYTSIAFDLTITSIFTPLLTGNAVVVYSGWNKGNLIERIVDDNKVGVVKLTPSHLYLIGEKKLTDSSRKIRRFVVGGEVLMHQIARDIIDNFNGKVEIYNEYGPTEATVGCMLYKFDPVKDNGKGNSVSIGVPAANVQIYLLDKNREPIPSGAIGEIYIGGDGLASGYLNNPELTAEKFVISPSNKFSKAAHDHYLMTSDRLYKTGDLARWLSDGNIEFLGRIDQQVKIRGFRIELGEIESQLLKHEAIKEAAVIIKETSNDKHICAYIVSGRELNVSELREYLTGVLPDYMVPLYFVQLDAIPLTPNGKVDMKALPEPETKAETMYIAPRDKTEKKLVEIWSEILGVEAELIGIDSNFFELGGHSLSGTVLTAKIHKAFDAKLALVDLFRLPTVRELSQVIDKLMKIEFIPIEPAEKKEYYALSSAQARLYILQHLKFDNIGYNMPIALEVEGHLDKKKLEETFRRLIERHENFRIAFELVNDTPMQRIYEEVDFRIDYSETTVEEEVEAIVKGYTRPFFLNKAPLLRVCLIKINENHHILMLDMHHIISDGISMNIFVKEFISLYEGNELPGLRLQYKDYSEWQNSGHEKTALNKQESFWLKQFEGNIPVLNLATDYARPQEQSFEGNAVSFEMGTEMAQKLMRLVLDTGVTLYIIMLAVYTILLSKLSGQTDIIVGVPIAGRKHADLQQIIGAFVNILPFRNYPDEEKTFLEFLKQVKQNALDALDNQDYPFEELIDKLRIKRNTGRNPLFDVAFMMENSENQAGDIRQLEIPGLKLKPYGPVSQFSKYDLIFYVTDLDKIYMKFEYCTKLFKQETIDILVGYVMKIIDVVLENPRRKLSEIDISSEGKNREVQYQFFDDLENE